MSKALQTRQLPCQHVRMGLVQQPPCRATAAPQRSHICPQHAPIVCQGGLYSFAEVEYKEEGIFKRNRGRFKKEGRELKEVVDGLCHMTDRQLQAVSVVAGLDIIEAIQLAAKLPETKQARKRQEGWVGKMMRTRLSDDDLDKIADAVEMSRSSYAPYVDRDVLGTVEGWRMGLMAGDQVVFQEVLSHLAKISRESGSSFQGEDDAEGGEEDGEEEEAEEEDIAEDASTQAAPVAEGATRGLPTMQELRILVRKCQLLAADLAALRGPSDGSWVQGSQAAAAAQQLLTTNLYTTSSPALATRMATQVMETEDIELQVVLQEALRRSRRGALSSSAVRPTPGELTGKALQVAGQQAANTIEIAAKRCRKAMKELNSMLKRVASATTLND
mmetsp:Transcript_17603/g.30199  ORF Transcript_17603/g.30199 Transcript_17603/m.30199 type:complete len:388 (+) Transcript_17603:149-1312(+)